MINQEHNIDRLIDIMCNAESELRLNQRDLLEIRRSGPRSLRQDSASANLTLCRLNRQQSRRAAASMRAAYAGGAV